MLLLSKRQDDDRQSLPSVFYRICKCKLMYRCMTVLLYVCQTRGYRRSCTRSAIALRLQRSFLCLCSTQRAQFCRCCSDVMYVCVTHLCMLLLRYHLLYSDSRTALPVSAVTLLELSVPLLTHTSTHRCCSITTALTAYNDRSSLH